MATSPAVSCDAPSVASSGGRQRQGTGLGELRGRRASQDGAIRDRQVTLIEARDDGLSQLAHVLTEEQAAPGSITLSEAPILGDELIKVVEAGQDGSTKGGAYSVQELLEKVEEVMLQLRERFRQQEDRFRHRCLDLNFDEWVIEHEFRKLTFDGHRRYMYGLALGVMLYSFIAILTYNVNDIVQLGEQNASSLKIELECLPASANLTANVTLPVSRRAQYDRLASALIFRAASGCLLVLLVLVLRCAPRKLALGAIVLSFWGVCFFFDMALYYENAVDDYAQGLIPIPDQNLPPLLLLMVVYTNGIPGIPFATASLCGWGTILVSLTTHLIFWGAQSTTPSELVTHNHWHVLAAQQLRLFLFNVFGCYVGIEQTRQMRLNFWHVRLLAEAVQLHQLCRQRFHALTRNTLPAPIVKAIAAGDTAFVKVYEACTVLQADMVGFTPLSSKYPPERVLGILSDIFEEFDSLCESHSVDKVKTIGDAYIVCAGALARPRADDAARVVRMGMGMQEVVKRVAAKERIDIAVRIGVHTGRCTGGIIGTVRFHFDMWGGAVYGAVKMEETAFRG